MITSQGTNAYDGNCTRIQRQEYNSNRALNHYIRKNRKFFLDQRLLTNRSIRTRQTFFNQRSTCPPLTRELVITNMARRVPRFLVNRANRVPGVTCRSSVANFQPLFAKAAGSPGLYLECCNLLHLINAIVLTLQFRVTRIRFQVCVGIAAKFPCWIEPRFDFQIRKMYRGMESRVSGKRPRSRRNNSGTSNLFESFEYL